MIDDEPGLLEISKQFLELDHSISVDTVISANEALELIERREYDVLVSDYQMPTKDGIQLLKEIRGTGNSIPFIIFTGKGREEVAIEALNAGADFYLQKGGQPASQFAELANMIKQAFTRKEGERKLRISEERYRSLFENSVDAVMLTTNDFESTLSANPSACNMFRMTEGEIKKTGIKGLIIDDKAWENILGRLNQTGIIKGEFTYRRKDGSTFTGETTSGILTGHYGIARISMIVRDITDRKLSDQAIRESEARLRIYIDNAPEGIFIIDAKGNYQDVNRTACSMLKYSSEEMLRLNLKHTVEKSVAREALDGFRRLRKKGKIAMETILVRKDGIGIPVFLNAVELPNKTYMAFCTDIIERKRAVDALIESEERYRQLVESAAESIVVIQDGLLSMVNPMAIKIIGYSERELISRSFCSFVHPDDRAMVVETYQRRINGEVVPSRYELRLVTKNGFTKWFEISAVVIDWEGRPATLNFLMDITERKQMEDVLSESDKKFHGLFNLANDAILLHNLSTEVAQGRFIEVNRAACNMLGYSKEELLSMGPQDIAPPKFHPQLDEIRRQAQTKDAFLFEISLLRKDGTIVPVEASVHLVNYEGKKIWISHLRDITERKRTEEILKTSQQILEGIINSITVRVFWKDENLVYLGCNAIFAHDAGFSDPKEIIGKDDYQMGWRDQAEKYRDDDRRVIESGRSELLIEEHQTTPTGKEIRLLSNKIPLLDSDGKVVGVLGTYMDVTERKLKERALLESNRKLNLLSSITRHDINNQLMALDGNLTLLSMKGLDPASKELLRKSDSALRRISTMLQFTKEYEDVGVKMPIWHKVRDLVEEEAKVIALGPVKLVNEIPSDMDVFADPLIAKVLHNLIDNAVRHGGHITTLHFFVEEHDSARVIVCEDDGVGIAPEMKKDIFTHDSKKKHGFGLFLSREILAITDIVIGEEGELGKGAKFVLIVPAYGFRVAKSEGVRDPCIKNLLIGGASPDGVR